jgi:hypothetical protein
MCQLVLSSLSKNLFTVILGKKTPQCKVFVKTFISDCSYVTVPPAFRVVFSGAALLPLLEQDFGAVNRTLLNADAMPILQEFLDRHQQSTHGLVRFLGYLLHQI